MKHSSGSVSDTAVPSAETITNVLSFNWAQLESADYKEYIARLRAFGVPEKTIRDIILADINRLFRPKFAALRPPKKPKSDKFWENKNNWWGPNRDMTKEQREQTAALQKEQKEMIKELLGKDVYEQMAKESGYPDWTERMYGSLNPEQREKVEEIQQRFGEAQSDIYAKSEGYIDQDTQNELKALQRKAHDELAGILSPEQLEEYELRSSDIAQNMRWELRSFEPTADEFRAIFKRKQAEEDLSAASRSGEDDKPLTAEEKKALAQKRKELAAEFEKTLTSERMKEYKLMDDWAYRNLLEGGVPKESVFKIADMKKEAEDAASRIKKDKTLTQDQRTEALMAIRVETENTLTGLLGERRAKAYGNNGGWWIRNIAQKP